LPVSSSGRICVGRSPKFAKSQAPEREAQATETETDAVAAFVARKRKTVRQFIPIDSFANTRLQEQQQLSQGTSNIQHPTFDIQSQQCDSEKLVKAALHMDRDKYRE